MTQTLRDRLDGWYGVTRSFYMYYGDLSQQRRMATFYSQFIGPGDLCFDIGAHLGHRAGAWTRLGARVVAVEPHPTFARLLRLLHGHHPRVTILESALGPRPGRQTLLISRREPTVSTLSATWAERMPVIKPSFQRTRWNRSVVVPVTTLDALIDSHGVPVFTKIDVEGYDLAVLEGLSRPVPALSFEYIPPAWDLALACLNRLCALGPYSFNWSSGETMRFALPDWVAATELAEVLRALPADAMPGDVYARITA